LIDKVFITYNYTLSQTMYYFSPLKASDMSARGLVLSLLSSVGAEQQPVARLVHAGALFDIEPSTMRVAITRLQQNGLLESRERGVYQAGPKAKALTRRVQQWQDVTSKTRDWTGDWLVALTHHLGRTDRKQVRARERALALSGYRAVDGAIWVRPANLAREIDAHRRDLIEIGADDQILVLQASSSAPDRQQDWAGLWSVNDLERTYREAISTMSASLAGLDKLTPDQAARETLLIGQAVIRSINFDPLLPPELANAALFEEMVDAMKTYNEHGRRCWSASFEQLSETDET